MQNKKATSHGSKFSVFSDFPDFFLASAVLWKTRKVLMEDKINLSS